MTAFCWNPVEWIVNEVVEPMLDTLIEAMMPILQWGVTFVVDLLIHAFSNILFDILVILLKIVDFFSNAFFVFSGTYNIALRGDSGTFAPSDTFILQYLIENMGLTRVYWILTVFSAVICLIFTGIAILRSITASDFDPGKTVGKIWGRLGRTLLTFLVVPSMMIFGIELSTMVTGALVEQGEEASTVDDMIFLAATMDAAEDDSYNGSGASFTDGLRNKYFVGPASYETMDSSGQRLCREDFDFTRIDYIAGYILCFFMIFVLFGAALFAVRRLFEIMLLYLTAPLFVASIALDEGKRFESWRDMFVAKLVSSYGLIIMMTLYLNFVPKILGAGLTLSENGLQDSLMKLMLILGGTYALKNSHSLLLGVISPEAAHTAQTSVLAGMAMGMAVAGKVKQAALMAVTKGQSGKMGGGGASKAGGLGSLGKALGGNMSQVVHKSAEDAQKYS